MLVSSDGTAKGERQDKSGQIIKARLESLGITVACYDIVPDELPLIQSKIKQYVSQGLALVMTTGGTGLGPRDVTVEATEALLERTIPGIAEAMRVHGQQRTPYYMLSRGAVGQIENTIIINLPGSSKGTEESLDAVLPYLLHAYPMMGGGKHE